MKKQVSILTGKTVFDAIYQTALVNFKAVPKQVFMQAVQGTAVYLKAQFSMNQFNFVFNNMLYRYLLVEVDNGFYKAAHAS